MRGLRKHSITTHTITLFFFLPLTRCILLAKMAWNLIWTLHFSFFTTKCASNCFHLSLVRAFWSRTSQTIWPVGAGEVRVIISSSVEAPTLSGTLFSVTLSGVPPLFFNNLRSQAPYMHLSTLFGHSAAGWRHSGACVDRQDFSFPWGEVQAQQEVCPSTLPRRFVSKCQTLSIKIMPFIQTCFVQSQMQDRRLPHCICTIISMSLFLVDCLLYHWQRVSSASSSLMES